MSWTATTATTAPSSSPAADPAAGHGETCGALVAEFLRAHGHSRSLRALEVATSGRCSSGLRVGRLRTGNCHSGLEQHESLNAFASKLEAMASYSSKYDEDGGRGGGGGGAGGGGGEGWYWISLTTGSFVSVEGRRHPHWRGG